MGGFGKMKNKTQLAPTSVLIGAFLAASFTAVEQAGAQEFHLPSLAFGQSDQRWRDFTYLANDVVASANNALSFAANSANDALKMGERSQAERLIFVLTAGQIAFRATWANSIMTHEYAHFAGHQKFGLTDHYFVDAASGERFGWQEAWLNVFLGMDVGSPATSSGFPTDPQRFHDEGIETSLAGLNWQMNYTEHRLRDWLSGERRTMFDAPDLMLNRIYTMTYAIGDETNINNSDGTGDTSKFVRHIESTTGETNVANKMIAAGLIANALSPSIFQMGASVPRYVADGTLDVEPHTIQIAGPGSFTWDIPQYLNHSSMTLSPTLYWLPGSGILGTTGADHLLIGAGMEFPVIGEDDPEIRMTIDGTWDRTEIGAGVSFGNDGHLFEITGSYDISDSFQAYARGAWTSGQTLRGARNLPDSGGVAWIGLSYKF